MLIGLAVLPVDTHLCSIFRSIFKDVHPKVVNGLFVRALADQLLAVDFPPLVPVACRLPKVNFAPPTVAEISPVKVQSLCKVYGMG